MAKNKGKTTLAVLIIVVSVIILIGIYYFYFMKGGIGGIFSSKNNKLSQIAYQYNYEVHLQRRREMTARNNYTFFRKNMQNFPKELSKQMFSLLESKLLDIISENMKLMNLGFDLDIYHFTKLTNSSNFGGSICESMSNSKNEIYSVQPRTVEEAMSVLDKIIEKRKSKFLLLKIFPSAEFVLFSNKINNMKMELYNGMDINTFNAKYPLVYNTTIKPINYNEKEGIDASIKSRTFIDQLEDKVVEETERYSYDCLLESEDIIENPFRPQKVKQFYDNYLKPYLENKAKNSNIMINRNNFLPKYLVEISKYLRKEQLRNPNNEEIELPSYISEFSEVTHKNAVGVSKEICRSVHEIFKSNPSNIKISHPILSFVDNFSQSFYSITKDIDMGRIRKQLSLYLVTTKLGNNNKNVFPSNFSVDEYTKYYYDDGNLPEPNIPYFFKEIALQFYNELEYALNMYLNHFPEKIKEPFQIKNNEGHKIRLAMNQICQSISEELERNKKDWLQENNLNSSDLILPIGSYLTRRENYAANTEYLKNFFESLYVDIGDENENLHDAVVKTNDLYDYKRLGSETRAIISKLPMNTVAFNNAVEKILERTNEKNKSSKLNLKKVYNSDKTPVIELQWKNSKKDHMLEIKKDILSKFLKSSLGTRDIVYDASPDSKQIVGYEEPRIQRYIVYPIYIHDVVGMNYMSLLENTTTRNEYISTLEFRKNELQKVLEKMKNATFSSDNEILLRQRKRVNNEGVKLLQKIMSYIDLKIKLTRNNSAGYKTKMPSININEISKKMDRHYAEFYSLCEILRRHMNSN